MARLARVVVPDVPHHVTQRGNRRQETFLNEDDYRVYLELMAEWCGRCGVTEWGYCLMPNHVNSRYIVRKVGLDIYPNRTPNRVFLSRYYTVYVGVLGSAGFDVTTLDSTTVKFGRTGTETSPVRAPMIRDLNGDGEADALYGFRTFDCGFQLGDTQGWLKGSTTSGTLVEGSDSVLVSP